MAEGNADSTLPAPRARGDAGDTVVTPPAGAEDRTLAHGAPAPSAEQESPAGKLFAERFELVRLLGEGGMGRVYLAKDRYVDNRSIALKVLIPRYSSNESFRSLFFREIKTAQRFVSEHVCQVRDTGQTTDGTLFLTMDLVKGEDLSALLAREQTLNVRHALDITLQILRGLQSGHDVGFVHRDIKPSNVMLAERATKTDENPFGVAVRLLDFGIAGLAAEIGDGELIGTPTYMSPEQVQCERLDPRSDLFSVGVLLYEMLAGARPFEGKTVAQITSSILETDVEPLIRDLSQLSRPLQSLLSKALAKDRDKRFQSAAEFIKAIERSKAYRLPKVMPAWAAALLVLLLGGTGVEGWLLWDTVDANTRLQGTNTELVRDVQRLQSQLAAIEVARVDERVGDVGQRVDVVKSEVSEVDKSRLEDQIARLESDLQEVREERKVLQDDLARLQADSSQKQREIDGLLGEVGRLKQSTDPSYVLSRWFNSAMLAHLASGRGEKAAQSVDYLLESGTVAALPGEDWLREVCGLAHGLQLFRVGADEGSRSQATAIIALHLPSVRSGREAFLVDAHDWLWYGAEDSAEPPRVVAELGRLLDAEGGLLAEAQRALDSGVHEVEQTWSAIRASDPLQSPRAVSVLAARVADGREYLSQELERFALALDERLAPGGELMADELLSGDAGGALAEWVQLLAGQAKELARSEAARSVLRFEHARRWLGEPGYVGGEPLDRALFAQAAGTSPEPAWWTRLRLEHELVQETSAYPAASRLVYRVTYKGTGMVLWHDVTFERAEENGRSRATWNAQVYSRDGSERSRPVTRTIERVGKRFVEEGTGELLFDLSDWGSFEVRNHTLGADEDPPSQIVTAAQVDRFRRTLGEEPIPCLVVTTDGTVRWVSPRYGLVFRDSETVKFELVYGSYAR